MLTGRAQPAAADAAGGGKQKQPDYTEAIQAAVQQLADETDVNAMMILQAKITCLQAQQKTAAVSRSYDKSPLGNKLPADLVSSYDFLQSNQTIVEHLETLDDFLFLRKDQEYHVHFLIQTLKGDTLRLFREQLKATLDMSYQDACRDTN